PNAINLPENTWIIGEAQVQTSQNLITEITARNPSADLYISTFDASIALKEAIRDVLDQSSPDSVSIFRRKLRKALQEGSFFSSERRRRVEFTNGEILEPPKTPLYRVSVERHVENINLDRRKSWVEIRINDDEQPTSHLEGPMVVELIPHGEDLVGKEVQLQVEGVDDDPVTVQKVELNRHGSRVTFVPSSFFWETWFPNTFMMSTNETPVKERVKVEGLGWPVSYLLAVLIALFGALLYIWHKKQRKKYTKGETTKSRMTLLYVVERCVAGIVIAFLIIHIAPILEAYPSYSWIPVPQFGSSPWISAVISGLMGGWLGLNPIVGLVASVIGTFTPLFKSDS
nr:MFS transporter [candidate division KSB1 bacterium]NIS28216.1 MFS transporter [candidate division KSB1 bacterium]NIT72170.1 MFS transporter [candidate division KSB1 bacterium]NIU28894.1 MFS transporter [candidate division KSB1 bacterium]NIU90674.1 hypothetical protein [candidate division KSB1 bacterium]